ncbi:MAG: prolipoprotein diacylglyceryl transferase [Clostridiales bacterium]|jgi:prolipoprotein diacylglyceryl transferase|nr:prolipoprotein diacylglyceryl transferase [Clostridiales bacterium]
MSAYVGFNLTAAAILTGYAACILKKQKLKWLAIFGLAMVMVFGYFIGSRVLYAILYLDRIMEAPSKLFELRLVNFSLYGGLILCSVLWFVFLRRFNLNPWKISDLMAPVLGISIAISKMGCFFNGCCYGIPTTLPWGMIFERADKTPTGQIFNGGGTILRLLTGSQAVYRHPTQLYEVFFALLASIVAIVLLIKLKGDDTKYLKKMGLPTLCFVIILTIGRFLSFMVREFPYASPLSNFIRGPLIYGFILIACIVFVKKKYT